MRRVSLRCLTLIALISCLLVWNAAWQVKAAVRAELPDPVGFVNDFASVLSSSEVARLEQIIREGERQTGAEVAIAIVSSAGNYSPKEYAVALFQKWGVGKKGIDNGLLILLVMDVRRLEIEVGYGLEHVITDSVAGRIRDTYLIPRFREGKYAEGLELAVREIYRLISASGSNASPQQGPGPSDVRLPWELLAVALLFVATYAAVVALFVRRSRRCPVCGRQMKRREVVARVATPLVPGLVVITWFCSNCGYSRSAERLVRYVGTAGGWPGGWFGPGFPIGRSSAPRSGGGFGGFGGGRSGGGGAGGNW